MINRSANRLLKGMTIFLLCLYLFDLSVTAVIHPLLHHHAAESHHEHIDSTVCLQHVAKAEFDGDCPFCHITIVDSDKINFPEYRCVKQPRNISYRFPDNFYHSLSFTHKQSRAPPVS